MDRTEFMKIAAQEIDAINNQRENRIIELVERAWAEGKRNAEVELLRNAIDEALAWRNMTRMRHGHWIKSDVHTGIGGYKCSACRNNVNVPTFFGMPLYKYCPECGAMMEEKNNE